MLLANKVAIISGGATGMGRAIALKFAEEGCHVAVADINVPQANETIRGVVERGREGLALECDIASSEAVQAVVDQVMTKFGRINILVNSAGTTAGVAGGSSVAAISEGEWDRIVAINLKGAFLFTRAVVPQMKKQRDGRIINISSLGAVHPPTVSPHYHAAKAGLLGMTYDTARELGPFNIRINAIMPGPIRTPFYDKLIAAMGEAEKEAFFECLGKEAPLQRMGRPEDIAGAALFLASDLSAYVTAAVIPVSGGLPLEAPAAN
ncbi:MAG: SDR family oxidoreductase [Firmicutes bacterium]|jgi:3-oxoacyl-[acyl-carrier protein] reductase|nr:SDR family oxidoreductase [Bacillota bacterium]